MKNGLLPLFLAGSLACMAEEHRIARVTFANGFRLLLVEAGFSHTSPGPFLPSVASPEPSGSLPMSAIAQTGDYPLLINVEGYWRALRPGEWTSLWNYTGPARRIRCPDAPENGFTCAKLQFKNGSTITGSVPQSPVFWPGAEYVLRGIQLTGGGETPVEIQFERVSSLVCGSDKRCKGSVYTGYCSGPACPLQGVEMRDASVTLTSRRPIQCSDPRVRLANLDILLAGAIPSAAPYAVAFSDIASIEFSPDEEVAEARSQRVRLNDGKVLTGFAGLPKSLVGLTKSGAIVHFDLWAHVTQRGSANRRALVREIRFLKRSDDSLTKEIEVSAPKPPAYFYQTPVETRQCCRLRSLRWNANGAQVELAIVAATKLKEHPGAPLVVVTRVKNKGNSPLAVDPDRFDRGVRVGTDDTGLPVSLTTYVQFDESLQAVNGRADLAPGKSMYVLHRVEGADPEARILTFPNWEFDFFGLTYQGPHFLRVGPIRPPQNQKTETRPLTLVIN